MICLLKHFKLLKNLKMEREGEVVYFMPSLLNVNLTILSTSYKAVSSSSQIPSLLIRSLQGKIHPCGNVLGTSSDSHYKPRMGVRHAGRRDIEVSTK